MLAVDLIELNGIGCLVLRPITPVPVASFRNQDFFPCALQSLFASIPPKLRGAQRLTPLEQQTPVFVVFFRADPNVEIRADPRPGEDVSQWIRRNPLEGFA